MQQQQQKTAAVNFDFIFKPVKTKNKSIRFEALLKEFRILNFINGKNYICKIYINNGDVLKPFLNQLSANTLYDVYALDHDDPFAEILIFQKNNILNYTVKSTTLNIETITIEKQNSNLI